MVLPETVDVIIAVNHYPFRLSFQARKGHICIILHIDVHERIRHSNVENVSFL